jgi:hypothetical protein
MEKDKEWHAIIFALSDSADDVCCEICETQMEKYFQIAIIILAW